MTNNSIKAAFQRFWEHVVSKIDDKADINHTHTLSSFGLTATADELNKMDGITATTTELNYIDGVTSNIQTQLDSKMTKENPVGTGSFSMNRKANTTVGTNSVAEGINATASGAYSHAEGYNTTAEGDCSHAEGGGSAAIGDYSHAEGTGTIVEGTSSHAEGYYTVVTGNYSHAEGRSTTVEGDCSHAEGDNTDAKGDYSHAEGYGAIASSDYQHVQGKYNIEDTANVYAHIVGNGDSTACSNAHTLDWDGNAWFAGGVSATSFNGYTLGKSVPSDAKFTDNNTTYTFATGDSNGQIKVTPSGGSAQNISVKGLGSAAYTASTAYATAAQGTKADNAMPKSGGTFTGDVTCNSGFTTKAAVEIYGATPYIDFHFGNSTADYTSRIIESASGTLTINGVSFLGNEVQVTYGNSLKSLDSSGTTRSLMYLGDSNHLQVGRYSSNGHTGSTYVNSYTGAVNLRNKTTSLQFTNSTGSGWAGAFMPESDGKVLLGGSSHRWYKLYAASACSTSDEREKSDIMSISDYPTMYSRNGEGNIFEQLFDKLVPKTYILDIEETGEMHIGFVAQDISKSMEELGLTEDMLGLIDHNYWTDEETGEEKDRYALAYDEFIALNTYMIQKQKAKIATLEERIAQLEELVSAN